jgi:uncharacterized protein YndB with AHSA1/START domain
MHTITATRTVETPVATVWDVIDDFGNIYRYQPTVEHSETINDVVAGKGARRRWDFYDGGSILEEVVESLPEQRQVVEMFDFGPLPLRESVGSFDLDPLDRNTTEVTMTMSFVPGHGPVGWLMAKLVMERQFRGIAEGVLAGLDTHLQTRATVGRNGGPDSTDSATEVAA